MACAHPGGYTVIQGYAQGGTYAVKFNLSGVRVEPERIHSAVDSILQRVDTTLSGYNKGSMLSRFNRGETVWPNDLFLDVYDFSRAYFDASEGALDVAAGPVFDIWGFGFTTDSLPPQSKVDSALAVSGMKRLVPSLRDVLREDGSLRPADVVREGDALPRLNYNAVAQGVVTSGNYRKFYIRDGRKFGHTLDPRTGYPAADSLLSATIVTSKAADADAVATWAMVLGFEKARALLLSRDDLEGYLIYASRDNTMKHWASPGFNLR